MKISVRISIDGLKRKIGRVRGELPRAAETALRALAAEAIGAIEAAPESERRDFIERHIGRQLTAIFVPVALKHKRRELWPDLEALYRARILRGQRSVGGRKRFYVDEGKEDALFAALVRRALARRRDGQWEVRFVVTSDRRYRVEIIRRTRHRSGGQQAAVMVAFAKQRIKVVSSDTLQAVLNKAGLR